MSHASGVLRLSDNYSDEEKAMAVLMGYSPVLPGKKVTRAGRYRCADCGAEESFQVDEQACDCKVDADRSQWLLQGPASRGS
jgi:hypothetical protein